MAEPNVYDYEFDAAGKQYNVDPRLLKTVFAIESSSNPNTPDSPQGAQGGMQLMPETAARLGVTDPRNMTQAIPAAAQYLRQGLDTSGTPEGALAYYHGGPDLREHGPRTAAYVAKGQTTYPKVAAPPQEPDVVEGILSNKPPPAAAGATNGPDVVDSILKGPSASPGDTADVVSNILKTPASPPPAAAVPANPQTGQGDTIAPGIRNLLAQDPNSTYGNVLPLRRDNSTGKLSIAIPGAVNSLAGGLLDLAEGAATGTVTPQGTMTLGNMLIGAPGVFGSPASAAANAARGGTIGNLLQGQAAKEAAQPGILSPGFKANPGTINPPAAAGPTSPSGITALGKLDASSTPNANASSPQTIKFVQMLHSALADRVAHGVGAGVGHLFGNVPGAIAGYYLAPVIKDVIANYGPEVGAAVTKGLAARMGNLLVSPSLSLPAFQAPTQAAPFGRPLA